MLKSKHTLISGGIPHEYKCLYRIYNKCVYEYKKLTRKWTRESKAGGGGHDVSYATRSCFMRSKRGGHGWPLTEMTMQIGRSAIGFCSMSHRTCVVTVVNNTGFIYFVRQYRFRE